ncbi:MAG: hypothetical protein HY698_22145 [Deltaproteobacteria bacterium]|nr:hypothetical protein [Deltaproteobacteria bacterium]
MGPPPVPTRKPAQPGANDEVLPVGPAPAPPLPPAPSPPAQVGTTSTPPEPVLVKETGSSFLERLAEKMPQSPPGTLLGIPLSLLTDQGFEQKILLVSAAALLVTRVIPLAVTGGEVVFPFSNRYAGWLFGLAWPLFACLCYAGPRYLPQAARDSIPPVVLRWAPFVIAFLSSGVFYVAVPGASALAMMGMRGYIPDSMGLLAWGYPVLVFGLICRLQDPEDAIWRWFIGIGAFLATTGGLSSVRELLDFEGNFFMVVHNLLAVSVALIAIASFTLAMPEKRYPQLAPMGRFASVITAVLAAWIPTSALLNALWLATREGASTLNFFFLLAHLLATQVAYLGVLLLTAPEAIESLKKLMQAQKSSG